MIERGLTYDDAHSAFEKAFYARALARSDGNIVKAAALIGVHRNTLGRKAVRTGCACVRSGSENGRLPDRKYSLVSSGMSTLLVVAIGWLAVLYLNGNSFVVVSRSSIDPIGREVGYAFVSSSKAANSPRL